MNVIHEGLLINIVLEAIRVKSQLYVTATLNFMGIDNLLSWHHEAFGFQYLTRFVGVKYD